MQRRPLVRMESRRDWRCQLWRCRRRLRGLGERVINFVAHPCVTFFGVRVGKILAVSVISTGGLELAQLFKKSWLDPHWERFYHVDGAESRHCSDIIMEVSDRSVARTEFGAALAGLGLAQDRVARLFNVHARAIRRWETGASSTPTGAAIVIGLLVAKMVTVEEVERVAVQRAKLGAPAPLPPLVAPAPTSVAPIEAAARADSSSAPPKKSSPPPAAVGRSAIPGMLIFPFAAGRLPGVSTARTTQPGPSGPS